MDEREKMMYGKQKDVGKKKRRKDEDILKRIRKDEGILKKKGIPKSGKDKNVKRKKLNWLLQMVMFSANSFLIF